jgi:hypothetical protein
MNRFQMIATWYSARSNWVRLPLDTILFAIVIFAIAAPLFHFDPQTLYSRPTLDALRFAACFSPVSGFLSMCLRDIPL